MNGHITNETYEDNEHNAEKKGHELQVKMKQLEMCVPTCLSQQSKVETIHTVGDLRHPPVQDPVLKSLKSQLILAMQFEQRRNDTYSTVADARLLERDGRVGVRRDPSSAQHDGACIH